MQKLSMEIDSHLYVAKIINISKNNDITEYKIVVILLYLRQMKFLLWKLILFLMKS